MTLAGKAIADFYNNVDEEKFQVALNKLSNKELLREFETLNDLYESSDINFTKLGRLIEYVRGIILFRMDDE